MSETLIKFRKKLDRLIKFNEELKKSPEYDTEELEELLDELNRLFEILGDEVSKAIDEELDYCFSEQYKQYSISA